MKTHFLPWLTCLDSYWTGGLGFWSKNDGFDWKWQFWPETSWKLIFYPGRHGLIRINPVDSVLIKKWRFWPKMMVLTQNVMKTHFLSWSTWFDPYWPGEISFYEQWWFWPKMTVLTRNVMKTHFLPWSTWFDPYGPGGLGFDKKWWFWPKMTVLTRNVMKTHYLPRSTWFDLVDSVLIKNDGFDPKRHENSFFTLVDMVWPVLTRWTRFW